MTFWTQAPNLSEWILGHLRLYNSAIHNMYYLMFEYILNWPDHRLTYFSEVGT